MSTVITPFQGTDSFSTATFNNRISQINTGFSYISNPNLLDNWYFGNPVNQRGQTSYTGVGYGIDRWKFKNVGTVLIKDGYIQVTQDWGINQLFPALPTGTYTFSALIRKSTAPRLKFIVEPVGDLWFTDSESEAAKGDNWTLISRTFTGAPTNVDIDSAGITSTFELKAVKLELGTTQTLAHQENGVWVPNEIPDYGEQLARCQRYYYQVSYVQYQTINMAYEDTAYAFILLPLPVEMRLKNPVLKQSAPIALGSSVKTLVSAEATGCMARLGINYSAIANAGRSCYSYCPSAEGVTFSLSADL